MLKIADVTCSSDTLMVSGDLNFDNVPALYQKAISHFSDYSSLVMDFSGVTSSNSAGIAFIVECIKEANRLDKPITFTHLSDDILAITAAAGLDELIITH